MSQEPGYVYILTNPSFKEDWIKIGKSSREVDIRSKELDNTAVPLPFEIYATIKTLRYNELEKVIHRSIDRFTDLRIRQNREFFNIDPETALGIFEDYAKIIDDSIATRYKNNHPITDETRCNNMPADNIENAINVMCKKRPKFKFSMVGIPYGAELICVPTGVKVKVASDNQIEYEGRLYSLSFRSRTTWQPGRFIPRTRLFHV